MGPKTEELIVTLQQIEEILRSEDELHWAKWMSSSRQALEKSDIWGIEKLLQAYGGMGSFNDLVLSQPNKISNGASAKELGRKDARLSTLSSKAYELANYIKRNSVV